MDLITQHPAIAGIGAYWLFSAFVGGMPTPYAEDSPKYNPLYSWFYNSLHILAGNLTSAVASKYPNLPTGATVHQETTQQTTIDAKKV